MSQSVANANNGIHCNNCNYEGVAKTNSATLFWIFFILLCSSVFLLPLIVLSLIFMGYIVSKPAKKSCPSCKSSDVRNLTDEEAGLTDTSVKRAASSSKDTDVKEAAEIMESKNTTKNE